MLSRLITAGVFGAILLTAPAAYDASTKSVSYRYREVTGDRSKEFSWHISHEGELVEITVEGEDRLMVNRCLESGETVYWSIREKGKAPVTTVRRDDTLQMTDQRDAEPDTEKYEIDGRPWFQPLSYSLRRFLFSDREKISFWCVRQDTLEVVPLTATKIGREKLQLDGGEFDTIKVEIRMTGIFAPFWHGTYWYREDNGLFLRYQGVNGPPGTARTTISLVERIRS